MNIFVDTAGLFALLVGNDDMHSRAKQNFAYFSENHAQLLTSSFVLVETTALLQSRIGLSPVHDLHSRILPLLEVIWVDGQWYGRAMQRLLAQTQRSVSLVDCLSFEIMEVRNITEAFTFDQHFEENGFKIAAYYDLDIERE